MAGRALAVLVVVLALFALPGQAATRPGGKLVPEQGTLLGAYLDGWGSTPYVNVTGFEARLGRKLDIDHRYWAWDDGWPFFGAAPYHYERWDVENGRIPLVSWDYLGAGSLDAILDGSHDALVRSRAREVARFGDPLFLRWGYEMNGSWMPWSGYQNGRSAAKFVAAWRRLHDLFVAEGATNAVWVWAPNAASNPDEPWNDFRNYYPGDEYVDWVGIDGYNWGTTEPWSRWQTFAEIVRPVYDAYADRKPVMVAETGSTEHGGSKADWLLEARAAVQREFPSIAALVYFNYDHGGYDWELTSSAAALDAFRSLAADPHFNPAGMPPGLEPQPLPSSFPGTVALVTRGARARDVRTTSFRVVGQGRCLARRSPYACRFETPSGRHAFRIAVETRARESRRLRLRVRLDGYRAGSVVFRVNRRTACVDRGAPYRCRLRVAPGRRTLHVRFSAETALERQTLARVRVMR